jgi:hypothetical protein
MVHARFEICFGRKELQIEIREILTRLGEI